MNTQPERVDVGRRADVLAADLLGRHVVQRAERLPGPREVRGLAVLGQPEVRDVGAVAVEQDVRRLDVAVHEPAGVQRVDPRRGALQQPERAGQPDLALGDDAVGQRAARDQRLHEVGQAALLAVRRAPARRSSCSIRCAASTSRRKRRRKTSSWVSSVVTTLTATGSPPSAVGLEDDPHAPATDDPGDPVGTYGVARPGLESDLRHSSAASIVQRWARGDPNFRRARLAYRRPSGDTGGSLWTGELSVTIGSRGSWGRGAWASCISRSTPQGARWPSRCCVTTWPSTRSIASASAARAGCSPR